MKCLIVIIAIVVFICGIIWLAKGTKDWQFVIGFFSLILSGGTLLASLILVLQKNSEIEAFEKDYIETKYCVENYKLENDTELVVLEMILNDVKFINKKIQSNRKLYDNMFVGFKYSKEIAKYELISVENLLNKE